MFGRPSDGALTPVRAEAAAVDYLILSAEAAAKCPNQSSSIAETGATMRAALMEEGMGSSHSPATGPTTQPGPTVQGEAPGTTMRDALVEGGTGLSCSAAYDLSTQPGAPVFSGITTSVTGDSCTLLEESTAEGILEAPCTTSAEIGQNISSEPIDLENDDISACDRAAMLSPGQQANIPKNGI